MLLLNLVVNLLPAFPLSTMYSKAASELISEKGNSKKRTPDLTPQYSIKARVSSRIFQLSGGGGGGGVLVSLAILILYLITTLGKSLSRPFPGVAIKQRVWSARLEYSRSSMKRDLSMQQCIPLTLLEREGGGVG